MTNQKIRAIPDYNKILKTSNHRIERFFTDPTGPQFALVKVTGKGNWFQRMSSLDIVETLFMTNDYKKLCQEAEELIRTYRSKNGQSINVCS